MNIRRSAADAAFSLAVRWRSNWHCDCCGRKFAENAANLHCSHIFSRRHYATRYDPDNAVSHCFSCHQRLGENPVDFARWAENFLGADKLEAVRGRARTIRKRRAKDQPAIARHFRAEAARIERQWTASTVWSRPELRPFPFTT